MQPDLLSNGNSSALNRLEDLYPASLEWRYEMRREAQETLPGLFVGPFQPSWNLQSLGTMGITHILCIAESREQHLFRARYPDSFQYLIMEVRDADDENLIRIFPQCFEFIDNALQNNGRVLVHCGDGISRSPAIVLAYIMCKCDVSSEDAFLFTQARRFCIAPRVEFQHQIEAYKPIFMARLAMAASPATVSRGQRRARDDDDDQDSRQRVPIPHWDIQAYAGFVLIS